MESGSISRIVASAFEIDTIVSMLKPLLKTALEFQEKFNQCLVPIVSKLSKGLASLPNELLAIIFDYTINVDRQTSATQALYLSHVSLRFRSVTLSGRSFWTTLHSCSPTETLRTIVDRSGPTEGLHVVLHHDGSRLDNAIERFMENYEHTSPRWKSLLLTQSNQGRNDLVVVDSSTGMEFCLHALQWFTDEYELKLPQLEELKLHGNNEIHDPDLRTQVDWDSPNLRVLRCLYFLPSVSNVFDTVTTFTFTQSLSKFDYISRIHEMLFFISSMPSLSSLEVDLEFAGEITSLDFNFSVTVCPEVRSFRFGLRALMLLSLGTHEAVIGSFLGALCMPLLDDLSISVGFKVIKGEDVEGVKSLVQLNNVLFPRVGFSESLVRIESLSLELWRMNDPQSPHGTKSTAVQSKKNFRQVFTIPLDRIPKVSSLVLKSCFRSLFTWEGGPHGINGEATKEGKHRLSKIKFVRCEDIDIEHLRFTVQSLKDIDAWDSIGGFVVEDPCCRLHREEVLDVVGRERFQYS